jgi:hypothetical protein
LFSKYLEKGQCDTNFNGTSLAATMVRWFEGEVNQGLLPMTISEEESNLFRACHLLNCDEGQGNSKWCNTQKKRNKPVGDRDHEVLGMR